jgi:hypothetical protein
MTKLITFILSVAIAWVCYAEGSFDGLQDIQKLEAEHKYPEALAAYKKYFEESKFISSMGGVRLSFGLSAWAEFGEKYPPAKAVLFHMSDERKKQLLGGEGDFDVFQEYNAINRYVGRDSDTLNTFIEIDKRYPEQAKQFFIVANDLLVRKKRYDLLKKYLQDPIYDYEGLRNSREYNLGQFRKNPTQGNLNAINEEFTQRVQTLIETTEKIGMQDEAKEIKARYDAYMNGNLLRKYH